MGRGHQRQQLFGGSLCTLSGEVTEWFKMPSGSGMLDIKGLYDCIEWDLLVFAALKMPPPPFGTLYGVRTVCRGTRA